MIDIVVFVQISIGFVLQALSLKAGLHTPPQVKMRIAEHVGTDVDITSKSIINGYF
jgi:hypothetical protein